MSVKDPKSTHMPGVAGGIEMVTGEQIIDTGLHRGIKSCIVAFVTQNFVADEECKVSWFAVPTSQSKIRIRVEKGGLNDGNIGTNPVKISWIAISD